MEKWRREKLEARNTRHPYDERIRALPDAQRHWLGEALWWMESMRVALYRGERPTYSDEYELAHALAMYDAYRQAAPGKPRLWYCDRCGRSYTEKEYQKIGQTYCIAIDEGLQTRAHEREWLRPAGGSS